jgi:Mrp family chromosome partitioning ATPase
MEEGPADYRGLLQRLAWPGGGPPDTPRSLGVTGCARGSGVSTVAAGLAAAAAAFGLGPVLLVDANLVSPAAHRLLGVKQAPGLAEALADGEPPNVQPSAVADLAVLAAGDAEARLARAWAAPALEGLLLSLKDEFSLVVVDLPPAGEAGFAARMAGLLDGVLLAVESEQVRPDEARLYKDLLGRANARLLGAVLTKHRPYIPPGLDRFL